MFISSSLVKNTFYNQLPEADLKITLIGDVALGAIGITLGSLLIIGTLHVPLAGHGALILGSGIALGSVVISVADTTYYLRNRKHLDEHSVKLSPESDQTADLKAEENSESSSSEIEALIAREKKGEIKYTQWQDKKNSASKAIQLFLDQNPEDSFCQELKKEILGRETEVYSESKSNARIDVPNQFALQAQAKKYSEKYQIDIFVSESSQLPNILTELNANSTTPRYIGFLCCESFEGPTSHATPLLFYLPGNSNIGGIECALMDSVAKEYNYPDILKNLGLHESNIYKTTNVRQADHYSCRTGGLVLLRNALLSLKYHHRENGLKEALQEGQLKENGIEKLPPEWDYTEQITNKNLNGSHVVIRDCFSQKAFKDGRLAVDHRQRYSHEREFSIEVRGNWRAKHLSSPAPSGAELFSNEYCWSVDFKVRYVVNEYLLRKGNRMKNS